MTILRKYERNLKDVNIISREVCSYWWINSAILLVRLKLNHEMYTRENYFNQKLQKLPLSYNGTVIQSNIIQKYNTDILRILCVRACIKQRMPYGNTMSAMPHIPEYTINFNTIHKTECCKTAWKVGSGHFNQLDLKTLYLVHETQTNKQICIRYILSLYIHVRIMRYFWEPWYNLSI
jgi:hypothetical protein